MATNVTNAFQLLSDFLKEETIRIKEEDKQYNIRKTIEQTAKKFADLGPEARPEQIRSMYMDSLQTAAKNDAAETIPFITNMMTQSAASIREGRELSSDEKLGTAIGGMYGIDPAGMSGKDLGVYTGLINSTAKWIDTEDEEGKGYVQRYTMKDGDYVPGKPKILTKAMGLKTELALKLKYDTSRSGAYNLQQSTYEDDDGTPLVFNPRGGIGNMFVRPDGKPITAMHVKEGNESTLATRQKNIINSQLKSVAFKLSTEGKSLANLLKKYDVLPDEFSSSTLKNLNTDEYRNEAFSTISTVMPEIEENLQKVIINAQENSGTSKAELDKLYKLRNQLDNFNQSVQVADQKMSDLIKVEFGDADKIIQETLGDQYRSSNPNATIETGKVEAPSDIGDPAQFKGKGRLDPDTGLTWLSDGTKWTLKVK